MLKKLLSALLCSSILFSGAGLPVTAQEEAVPTSQSTIKHSGKIGTADWTIDSNGVLTIGTGEFTNYDNDYWWPWRDYRSEIIQIDGTAPFKITGSLKEAFDAVGQQEDSVESINLSGWDTSSVTNMGWMFNRCNGLTTLDLSSWDTSSVTSMALMFYGCSSLSTLDLSGWDTSSVTSMALMFSGCSSFTTLDLSGFDTSSVASMEWMFGECGSLTTLDLSSFDTSSVTSVRQMFFECSSLSTLDLSGFEISSDTYMWRTFNGCSSLANIRYSESARQILSELPEQSGWYQNENGPYSVEDLPQVPNGQTTWLNREGRAYGSGEFEYPGLQNDPYYDSLGLYEENGLIYQLFSDKTAHVEGSQNSSITEIEIPSSIAVGNTSFSVTGLGHYRNLNDHPELGKFSSRFSGLSSLRKVTVSPGIQSVCASCFTDCPNLEEVILPDTVTTYGRESFGNCSKLRSVRLSSSAPIDRDMFWGCTSLEEIVIPDGVSTIYTGAFQSCSSLKKVVIPASVTTIDSSRGEPFYGCPNLVIYGYSGTAAQNYASQNSIPFVDLSTVPSKPSARNPKEYYKPLIEDSFKKSCHQFLTTEANFTATLLVSEKDKKFSTEVISAMAHCYFGGIEGWEEQFLKTGSKKDSVDILLGLIGECSSNVEKVQYANKKIKYANNLMKALKVFQTGQMAGNLYDSNLISKLGDKIDSYSGNSSFLNTLYSQDPDKIAKFLTEGTDLSKSDVSKFINSFFDSSDYLAVIQDGLKYLGYGMKIMGASAKILDRICYLEALASADKIYFEYLDNVAEHSHYGPMKDAALEVKHALDSQYDSAWFVLKDALIDGGNFVAEKAIDKAISAFPLVKLAKTAYDLGSLASNLLFGISSKQQAYDKLRSITYMNQAGLYFCQMNRADFYAIYFEGDEDQIQGAAEKYMAGLSLLASGRISGEKILQTYLNGSGLFGWVGKNDELIRTSQMIQAQVEADKEYFDLQGKGKKYLSAQAACPVTFELLSQNGSSLVKLQDQIVDPTSKDGIHYSVSKYASGNDFIKTVSFPEDSNLNLQITGTGTGTMDYMTARIDDEGRLQIRSINNVPVNPNDRITANSVSFNSDLVLISANDSSRKIYRPTLVTTESPKEVSSISISPNKLSLQIGQTSRLNGSVSPSDAIAADLYWKSSNDKVATIDRNGIVKAISAGQATITAETLNGKKASIVVTVTKPVPGKLDINSGVRGASYSSEESWTGKPVTPHLYYHCHGRDLVLGKDYTLSYKNNVNPGTATIIVTGIGEFTGTAEYTFKIVKITGQEPVPDPDKPVKPVSMHRLYNPNSGEHFYTANTVEKDHLVKLGWKFEGEGWKAPETSNIPVYRLYNANAGDHHYTLDVKEKDALIGYGWKYEGIGWYSNPYQSVPLYRQYNPNAKAGSHNYTPNKKENDHLVSVGWKAEGIAWYGLK